ncbi:olfactory receptor 14J1-like [Ammospiza caudacuta]|uniref:olfactory receptor 14J1-like n=1 Tax=Ammospiza caudacuta TaxID=2857398 RepID=UPI00273A560A|nr:olfactory receptor 14J1-like [Ammospiza caudacuta]
MYSPPPAGPRVLSKIQADLRTGFTRRMRLRYPAGRGSRRPWRCADKSRVCTQICLLTIMSYDRYVSICKPLHYGTLLGSRACAHMAAAAWASAFLNALLHTANTFSLPLCRGNALGQSFCEIPQILKLSCSKPYLRELGVSVFTASLAFGCFVFIFFCYVQIFRVVLRIPSEQGRHKAFSTCLPHLAVVSLFYSTGTFAYLKPPSISSPSLDLALSVLHSVVPPKITEAEMLDKTWEIIKSNLCRDAAFSPLSLLFSRLGVICQFADAGLSPRMQIINADIEIHTGWL